MSQAALLSTRPQGDRDPLVVQLRATGRRVHAAPTVAIEPVLFESPDLARFDWVVVTSAAGAQALMERSTSQTSARWAAVGPRTASVLAALGIHAAAVPDESQGLRIADAIRLLGPLPGLRVLLARADAAAPDLPAALRGAGAVVTELAVYHTVIGPESSRPGVAAALADPALAAVLFASGSAVLGLLRLADDDPRWVPAVTIGPATSEVARDKGFRVLAQAERPSVEGLVAAVTQI